MGSIPAIIELRYEPKTEKKIAHHCIDARRFDPAGKSQRRGEQGEGRVAGRKLSCHHPSRGGGRRLFGRGGGGGRRGPSRPRGGANPPGPPPSPKSRPPFPLPPP